MRKILVPVAAAALMTFGGAGVAFADSPSNQYNCDDFQTQQQAQQVYNQDKSDPNRLDRDKDGIACESLPSGAGRQSGSAAPGAENNTGSGNTGSQVQQVPAGAADTGYGSTAGIEDAWLFAVGGAALAGAGALTLVGVRRRRTREQ